MNKKQMKDYFGKHFNVYVTDSFVKIEMKDETIVVTRAKFLQIQQFNDLLLPIAIFINSNETSL